jgi:predicted lysophospholipase L1 biosynthesis ABC-type transport system permease subunit
MAYLVFLIRSCWALDFVVQNILLGFLAVLLSWFKKQMVIFFATFLGLVATIVSFISILIRRRDSIAFAAMALRISLLLRSLMVPPALTAAIALMFFLILCGQRN